MFKCPGCGAQLRFDIASQRLACDYCGADYGIGTVPEEKPAGENPAEDSAQAETSAQGGAPAETAAEERGTEAGYSAAVYTCQNCGAELISIEQSAVGFCSYCGSEAVLPSRMERAQKPSYIIPFKCTKEKCKETYKKYMTGSFYAPPELRDPAFLERFRGIYIPYWLYRIHFAPGVTLMANKEERRGDYIYKSDVVIQTGLRGVYENIAFDASAAFDDRIANSVAPFSSSEMIPFQTDYLAGFYADMADVPKETYRLDAMDEGSGFAMDRVRSKTQKGNLTIQYPSSKEGVTKFLGTKCDYPEGALFPVWFLTWKKKDRVAYAVVNGATGKIASDVPVDMKRYMLGTLITAAILFVIAHFAVSMTAPTALVVSSVLALVTGILFYTELRAIRRIEQHLDDKGYFARAGSEKDRHKVMEDSQKMRGKDRRKPRKMPGSFVIAALVIGFSLFSQLFLTALYQVAGTVNRVSVSGLLAVGGLAVFVLSVREILQCKEKSMLVPAVTVLIAQAAALIVTITDPVMDYYYYAGSILCLIGVIVTSTALIRRRNLIATRPMPSLFLREGGNDSAKEVS